MKATTGLTYMTTRLCALLAALLGAVWLAACSDDTPAVPDVEGGGEAGKMSIGFRVAAPAEVATQADDPAGTLKPGYENGSELESTIDFASGSYRVYFFDADNDTFITAWSQVAEMHVIKTKDYWTYYFEGAVPEALKGKPEFKLMALANWPDYPERHAGVSLQDMTIGQVITAEWAKFDAFSSFELSSPRNLIPFYGLKTCTGVIYDDNTTYELGTVNMLRAVAKVELIVGTLNDGLALDGAPIIRGYNPRGFCATSSTPIGEGQDWESDYVKELHTPYGVDYKSNASGAEGNTVSMRWDSDLNRWIAYLPEFKNKGLASTDDCSRIELKLKSTDPDNPDKVPFQKEPFVIHFAKYNDDSGDPDFTNRYDIRRNDLYRFTVKGGLEEIKFALAVEPWLPGGEVDKDMATVYPPVPTAEFVNRSLQLTTIPGASIKYSIDNTSLNQDYTGPITLSDANDCTVSFQAYLEGYGFSAIGSYRHIVADHRVATPILTSSMNDDDSECTVTISCDTPGAVIRYTTDGSDPTAESTLYDPAKPPVFVTNHMVKARAFHSDLYDSYVDYINVRANKYMLTPVVAWDNNQLTISYPYPDSDEDKTYATIRYTHGTEWCVYSKPIPLVYDNIPAINSAERKQIITPNDIITIFARHKDGLYSDSPILEFRVKDHMVATPVIDASDDGVKISCATEDAEIRYTTDGTTPTAASTIYTGQFGPLSAGTTVKARAFLSGKFDSEVAIYSKPEPAP